MDGSTPTISKYQSLVLTLIAKSVMAQARTKIDLMRIFIHAPDATLALDTARSALELASVIKEARHAISVKLAELSNSKIRKESIRAVAVVRVTNLRILQLISTIIDYLITVYYTIITTINRTELFNIYKLLKFIYLFSYRQITIICYLIHSIVA